MQVEALQDTSYAVDRGLAWITIERPERYNSFRGRTLSFPIAKTTTDPANWTAIYEWQIDAGVDTFFAVVASNADVARRLANHMDKLPLRCSTSMRPGLKDDVLRAWLTEFASITSRSSQYIDWRAIQVRDIT